MKATQSTRAEKFAFASSIREDVWHPKHDVRGYEWWYFDALSDDGRDAVVVIFLDNFIFSPRYNSLAVSMKADAAQFKPEEAADAASEKTAHSFAKSKAPAVAFVYYRDGKPVYRAYNEYAPEEFSASEDVPTCKIGNSHFKFEEAPYGSGYSVSVNAKLRKGLNLEAHFEWLSIESDFAPDTHVSADDAHSWNLVAPRSDVTGRITITDAKGKDKDVIHFRGSGYHDHNLDNRWLPETVKDWQWGRAHFNDATAVFYRYTECGSDAPITKLYVVHNGDFSQHDAQYKEQTHARDKFGIKYPRRLHLVTDDNIILSVEQSETIDSSFFYLRFLSEMTLTLHDGTPRKALGITEHLAPKTLKYRWLDWLVSMRIGRNGKGSFLP